MIIPLSPRSNDGMDQYCKEHPGSQECAKPVNDNATIIAVCVVVPVVVILAVLGFFLWRNYRKDKKELLEHDPDFDETGDVTALPDYKSYGAYNGYGKEPSPTKTTTDPFANDSLLNDSTAFEKKPNMPYQSQFHHSLTSLASDPLESFLPTQHATESKVSLSDYIRQFPDGQGYSRLSYLAPHGGMRPTLSLSNLAYQNRLMNNLHQRTVSLGQTTVDDALDQRLKHGEILDANSEPRTASVLPFEENFTQPPALQVNNNDTSSTDEDDDEDDVSNFTFELLSMSSKRRAVDRQPLGVDRNPLTLHLRQVSGGAESAATGEHEPAASLTAKPKLPRISQFNLLNNDSDEEGEHELTQEQEEEIQRMKLVYRVYFDKDQRETYQADLSNPLPLTQIINSHLTANTDYQKRMTTASLVYDAKIDEAQAYPHQQFLPDMEQGQFVPVPGGEQMMMSQQVQHQPHPYHQNFEQQYQPQPQPQPQQLRPLQQIPTALDIRMLTLQTYTDFDPHQRSKRVQAGVQRPVQQEFDPLEHMPASNSPAIPLATQLARSSVAMMNPTGIQRKATYKPAGALQAQPQFVEEHGHHDGSDLVPQAGEDVRRMMNSNF